MEIIFADYFGNELSYIKGRPIPFFIQVRCEEMDPPFRYKITLKDQQKNVRGYYIGCTEINVIEYEIPPTQINIPGFLEISVELNAKDEPTEDMEVKRIEYREEILLTDSEGDSFPLYNPDIHGEEE